jgi:sec-independent protein translocase protein TatA
MPNIGTPELLIILVAVLLIFGSAKLPQLARSLGKSARILKAETKGLRDDDAKDDDDADSGASPAAAKTAAPAPDARERAARLREEAARLEGEAAAGEGRRQGALPSGEAIEGVPVADYNARKTT